MSTISGIPSETVNTGRTSNTVMGKDDFLKMMIAQLKNQDPLNPLDGTEFTAQLAQFSSLEQMTNVNDQLKTLDSRLKSLNNGQLVSLIGSEVSSWGNTIRVDGTSCELVYELPCDMKGGTIEIYDDQGILVKTMEIGSQKAGINSTTWACEDVKAGMYSFIVSAIDRSGNYVYADTMMTGTVTGATFKSGLPYLVVNGQEVAFTNIVSVRKPAN